MWKEKLLKYWIERVEKAGYYVIPRRRVDHVGAQYSYDLRTEKAYIGDGQNLKKWQERELLLSLAYELGKVVRWSENIDTENGLRIVRAILTVIKPRENEDENVRCVPRFSDAPGRYAGPLGRPEAQGRTPSYRPSEAD